MCNGDNIINMCSQLSPYPHALPAEQKFVFAHSTFPSPPVAQLLKNLPVMWETWVQFLGWEDLLEKEMAIYSSILAWKIPWMEEPGRIQSMGSQRVGHD